MCLERIVGFAYPCKNVNPLATSASRCGIADNLHSCYTFSGKMLWWFEVKKEGVKARNDELIFVLLFILSHADRLVLHFILQHPVHHPGYRMSRCHGRLHRSQSCFHTPVHNPEDAFRLLHGLRRQYSNQFDRKPRCSAGLRLCASPLVCLRGACVPADSEYTFIKAICFARHLAIVEPVFANHVFRND